MLTSKTKIQRINLDEKKVEEREDLIALDATICVFINDDYFRTFIASPDMIRELVVGHLLGEGIASSMKEIKQLEISPFKVRVDLSEEVDLSQLNMYKVNFITTACGSISSHVKNEPLDMFMVSSRASMKAEKAWSVIRELNVRSKAYKETGGTHAALLSSLEGETLYFSEDVGRHNAVDKVIGAGAINSIDFGKYILASSGRLSGEIALKAARVGIPVIASVSGPLESGIRIAKATGITMIGFIRGRRMNVYTNYERVLLS